MSEADNCIKAAPAAAPTYVEQQPKVGDLFFTTAFRSNNQLVVGRVLQAILDWNGKVAVRMKEVFPNAPDRYSPSRQVYANRLIPIPTWYIEQIRESVRDDAKTAASRLAYLEKITKNE